MAANFIHFRSNGVLEELLDDEVSALKARGVPDRLANRSAVARAILTTYLECRAADRLRQADDGQVLDGDVARKALTRAGARELLESVGAAVPEALKRATADALARMPEHLEAAAAEAAAE